MSKYNRPPPRRPIPNPAPAYHVGPTPPDTDFGRALQAACDDGRVLQLHAPITLDAPVVIKVNHSHQSWFGIDGNHHRITSTVRRATTISFVMDDAVPAGTCARSMMLQNFALVGCGQEWSGLVLEVPFNDRWIVNPTLRDIWIEGVGGKAGLVIAGSIFEGNLYSVGTMNCRGAGAYLANSGQPGNIGVASALRWYGGTHRQNGAEGILIDQYDGPVDVRLFGLYFCENAKQGIASVAGLELVDGCGFENNHAGHAIYAENYAHLRRCTGSTGGAQTVLVRGYVVSRFLLDDCSLWNYGGGESVLADLEGGDVIVRDCEAGVVLLGGANYTVK